MTGTPGSLTVPDQEIDLVPHPSKNGSIQIFSSIQSRLLLEGLFEGVSSRILRVIGSCIADEFIPGDDLATFWGCGARGEKGLSSAARMRTTVLSVRGPLTRSSLRLGHEIPIGDTRLLLPLLHDAATASSARPEAVLVPCLHDQRSDDALRAASGCSIVLRPNLRGGKGAVLRLIDMIVQARFVLAGSLNAAVTAAAYDIPFAFWDSGAIDLPFKWKDFAASVNVPCLFHARLGDAEAWHGREAVPRLSLPPLWQMLAAAPLPLRPGLLIRAIQHDVKRHGAGVLDAVAESRDGASLARAVWRPKRAEDWPGAAPTGTPANTGVGWRTTVGDLQSHAETNAEPGNKLSKDRSNFEVRRLEHIIGCQERNVRSLHQMVHRQAMALEQLQLRAVVPAIQMASPDVQMLRERLRMVQAEHDAIARSTIWRVGRRLRAGATRYPRVTLRTRQVVKLAWWVVSLRLVGRLRQRRRFLRNLTLLQDSPLFDAMWYHRRHQDRVPSGADPLMHYMWIGGRQDLDPHPLFDARWYRSQMEGGSTADPLIHYLSGAGDHDPHPLFDTRHYLTQLADVLPAGQTSLEHHLVHGDAGPDPNAIFDAAAYRYEYPQAAGHAGGAFRHYVEHGEGAGLAPHALFDPTWYASRYPDRGGLGPLAHYLRHGRPAGYAGSAMMEFLGERLGPLPLHLAFPAIETPEITVIVPTYGHLHDTIRCLAAVMANTGDLSYEVLVVDDRPSDPIAPLLRGENLRVLCNADNLGFLRSCNAAAKHARGRWLVFLNNDTTVGPDWLRPMVALAKADQRVGMVGCKLLNTDGTVQEAGGIIHSNGWGDSYGGGDDPSLGAYNYIREVDVVTGACFLVRRDLFERQGGFDDHYAPAFYGVFDLALALRDLGYKVLYQPVSTVIHHGRASYRTDLRDRQSKVNHGKFCVKWRTLLAQQPVEGDPLFLTRERPSPRGMILVIDDKVPECGKHAGAVTLFQYLELMCELGLKVIFAPQDMQPLQPHTGALQRLGIEVVHVPETLSGWLRRNGRHLDYVWTARPDVTFPILDLIKRTTGAPILYCTHDLHYLREMRPHRLDGPVRAFEEVQRLRLMELDIFAAVDHVMTPSREEAEIIATEAPEARVTVVPRYLFGQAAVSDAQPNLVGRSGLIFVGGFDHTPDVDAARWLVLEIMPLVWIRRPEARVMIVGNAPPPEVGELAGPRVDVTGFVPTLDPYYGQARVSVSPLRHGAGVKGKIVGALQAGVPVVTTGCGNEGIQLRQGIEALIGETPGEIADAIVTLLEDDGLCHRLAVAGVEVVRTRFSTERARSVLLRLLGDDLCPVCGTRSRQPRIAGHGDWCRSISCVTCLATNRGAALAEVIVSPYRRRRVTSLRQALPLLRDLRIHAFGPAGAVTEELSRLPGFTSSEPLQGPSFVEASLDLLISQGVVEHDPDAEHAFAALFRVLRPGGRHVFALSGSTVRPHAVVTESGSRDGLMDRLRAIGFAVTMHGIGGDEDAARHIPVFEISKPR